MIHVPLTRESFPFLNRRQAEVILSHLDNIGVGCHCSLRGKHIPATYATDQRLFNSPAVVAKLDAFLTKAGATLVR